MTKRLIARYCIDRREYFELLTRFDTEILRERVEKAKLVATSIMPSFPAAIWFERKIADDFGIRFEGAFDSRPLLHHERWPKGLYPMRKDFDIKTVLKSAQYRPYRYETIGGDGVFEVAVGPIHAGIIEPGHFHFSQAGEDMLHQEVRHFYKYRGIEKMLEAKSLSQAAPIVARISGNESIAAQFALIGIAQEATAQVLPETWRLRFALLLELERLIHHWIDLAFIPNDAGFGAAMAWASARAEEARRLMLGLTGSRFGFDLLTKGLPSWDREGILRFIERMQEAIAWFDGWIADIPSLWDRMDTTGVLASKDAKRYGCVGVVARASGLALDARAQDPLYTEREFLVSTEESGDVAARFKVRIAEIKSSLALMDRFMAEIGKSLTDENIALELFALEAKEGFYESFIESSLGEIYMSIEIKDGKIDRFYYRDPSFVNWQALHLMMPGNIIADFPLINKSCDLSYAGNDL